MILMAYLTGTQFDLELTGNLPTYGIKIREHVNVLQRFVSSKGVNFLQLC